MKTVTKAIELISLSTLLIIAGVTGQETLEDRIQVVFGRTNLTAPMADNSNITQTVGFDVIVQPDPIVEVSRLESEVQKNSDKIYLRVR